MNVLNFFRRQQVSPVQVRVVEIPVSDLRLSAWRSDGNLTKESAKVLSGGHMQLMLSVLANEHPGTCVMLQGDAETRALQQARAEGYSLCLGNLKAMAVHQQPPKELGEPTFGIDEKE